MVQPRLAAVCRTTADTLQKSSTPFETSWRHLAVHQASWRKLERCDIQSCRVAHLRYWANGRGISSISFCTSPRLFNPGPRQSALSQNMKHPVPAQARHPVAAVSQHRRHLPAESATTHSNHRHLGATCFPANALALLLGHLPKRTRP